MNFRSSRFKERLLPVKSHLENAISTTKLVSNGRHVRQPRPRQRPELCLGPYLDRGDTLPETRAVCRGGSRPPVSQCEFNDARGVTGTNTGRASYIGHEVGSNRSASGATS